ncbi:MAG TPA: PilZ domain-containing protein [Terriglobales bacterium]|nr:PilZ domain-containing protein [Terriglobales bacterium]
MILGNLRSLGFGTYDAGIMALTSLLVCAEAEAVDVLSRVLQDLDIEVEVSTNAKAALASARVRHFDAVVVDCQEEASGLSIIAQLRRLPENGNAIVIALVSSQSPAREVLSQGADFLIYQPVSRERALDSLRAARGLIRQERRITPRIPVHVQALLDFPGKEKAEATLLELSESGLGLRSQEQLPPACKAYLQFSLEESESLVRLSGEVMWEDRTGRVGIRFLNVPQTSKRILHRWVEQHVIPAPSGPPSVKALAPDDVNSRLSAGLGLLSACTADRRNLPRRACSLGAEVYGEDGSVPHRSTLSDISTGGCYIETPEPFPQGTIVTIVVRTAKGKVCVAGRVESMNPGYGMGVRFTLNQEGGPQVEQLIACAESESEVKG